MTELLHYVDLTKFDEILNHTFTRCGLKGSKDLLGRPFPDCASDCYIETGTGNPIFTTGRPTFITCAKCKIRLTPTQGKSIRLMLQHARSVRRTEFKEDRKFSFHVGTDLLIYGHDKLRSELRSLGLIQVYVTEGPMLTPAGWNLAQSLPAVIDELDKPKRLVKGRWITMDIRKKAAKKKKL